MKSNKKPRRIQSHISHRKAWECYPLSVGGNFLGILPKVFIHDVFGKDFSHLIIFISVQSSTKKVGINLTEDFVHELFENVTRSPQE